MEINFEKWQGLGNDFIILEDTKITPQIARELCDRHFGIGADGIFCPIKTDEADIGWDFYNSDGSIAQMCGNGIRCFAKYVLERGLVKKNKFSVLTKKGIVIPEVLDNGLVRVDMAEPIFEAEKIPVSVFDPFDFEVLGFKAKAVSMGNPHCVIFTDGNKKELAVKNGAAIENSEIFPEKTNVEFVNIINRKKIALSVWERGCGITLACGTGACASVVCGIKAGLLENCVEVELEGGKLNIEYNGKNVYMTGDAKKSFKGVYYLK